MREILAPAGNKECAFAAINAGATAIYLGLDKFSARSSAENFDFNAFKEICSYARLFGVKVYVALNTVVKQSELDSFFKAFETAWNNGADAIIVQDLYLGGYLKKRFPQVKIHLSTQAGCCNSLAARMAKDMGFDRVILSRETRIEDIREICKIIETEVFVQGALCTAFSGQCYMSSFAGGNSGNRGRCKQPCRKLYSIDRTGYEDLAYRLSLSDLCVGEKICDLAEAGVSSFKIEGRMRRPEYVSAAVNYYKNLLNNTSTNANLSNLKRTYNRGNYTHGLAFGQDKSFLSSAVQGHIGEFIGVIKVENSKYVCYSKGDFSEGDGFKILRDGKEAGGGIFGGKVKGGFIVNSRERLKNGDKVFITTDSQLNKKLTVNERRMDLSVSAEFISGDFAKVTVNGKWYIGCEILEKALNAPLTVGQIEACFKKTDGFPYKINFDKIQTDGVFVPVSKLNAFRRKIFNDYYDEITECKNDKINCDIKVINYEKGINCKSAVICSGESVNNADILIYKPQDYSKEVSVNFAGEKYLYVPPYLADSEIGFIEKLSEKFDGLYCDSYFGEYLAKKLNKPLFAGTGFNFTNSLSLSLCNAKYVCVSKELTLKEYENIRTNNTFYLTEGNIKLMDLIYCPFGKKCADCDKRINYILCDGEGRKFPLRRYVVSECRFEVYNCANLECANEYGALKDRTLNIKLKEKTRGHSISQIL